MIIFRDWTISLSGPLLAMQYDNLSRRLDVVGDLPEGYDWAMLVRAGGNNDIILLTPTETGVGAVLTEDNLAISGAYHMQLRGTLRSDGVTTRHTNILRDVFVPESLAGTGEWPTVPSEFAQIERNILELNNHPPVPGSSGYWQVWDLETHSYVESEFPLPSGGGTTATVDGETLVFAAGSTATVQDETLIL